jgi:hypothetical protein
MREADTQKLTDGELFYIIKNGVRFTGMPAWGDPESTTDDESNWKLVHFIRHLPRLTAEELEEMKSLNPKTRAEWEAEAEEARFLQGQDSPSPAAPSGGHTHH